MTSRQKFFLGIAGLLLAVKFLLQPFIESQNQAIQDLDMRTARLAKVEPLVERADELKTQDEKLNSRLRELKTDFPTASNGNNLRVSLQRIVEQAVANQNVELNQFDWLGVTEIGSGSLLSAQFGVKIVGDINRVVGFHHELLKTMSTTRMQDFQLRTFIRKGKRVSELNAIFATDYLVSKDDE